MSNHLKKVATAECISTASVTGGCTNVSSGGNSSSSSSDVADTVVYGKVYTSNSKSEYAQALAVKDGKFIYVGDEDSVKPYIKDGITKVIDYRDKGLVMAGATEGHGHYVMQGVLEHMKLFATGTTEEEILESVKQYVADNPDKKVYYTFGWSNVAMINVKSTIDMRSKLDEICPDKVMLIGDDSGHNAFCNSKAFETAGVTKDTEIVGGVLSKNDSGELMGLVSDMALNYVLKHAVATEELLTESDYKGICKAMEEALHAYGYTYYQDGWLNHFGTQVLDCLNTYDKKTGLSVLVSGTHKIDSYDDWKAELSEAEEYMKKYPTDHFKYNTIKLFADGEAVESMSGWMLEGYADGTHGTQVWQTDVMNELVKSANEKGLSLHVHSQGDGASEQVVNAFINAEGSRKSGVYNGICHGRNITEDTKKKMGEHNIYASININWRTLVSQENASKVPEMLSEELAKAGYPVKSLLDNGVNVTSSTDVPAASGAPVDVSGIIEVAVNGTRPDMEVWQLNESEKVSIEEALNIMTINGAKQLMVEDTRGSIEAGKYADFLLLDKDITTCDKDKIHEGKVASVYFEGKEVYTKDAKSCGKCDAQLEAAAPQTSSALVAKTEPVAPTVQPAPDSAQQTPPQQRGFRLVSDEIDERQYVVSPFGSGWADTSNSKGWFARSLLLALCSLVPILDWVVKGFSARWGREVCLGVNRRLPSSILDDDTFIAGAKIWLVDFIYGIVFVVASWLLLKIPIVGPILIALGVLAYVLFSPLLNFQVALSGKISVGFSGIGRAFTLFIKKPIKTLAATFAPFFVVNLIALLCSLVCGGISLVLLASSAMNSLTNLFSGFTRGANWLDLINTFVSDFIGIYTAAMYVVFVIMFFFKLAGVISNIWMYRSVGHLVAREAPEWLTVPNLVDSTNVDAPNGVVDPYIPLKNLV